MTDLKALAAKVRAINEANGWDTLLDSPIALIANLSLIHTEVSEATEEVRDGNLETYFTIGGRRVYPVIGGSGADWTIFADGHDRGFTWTGVTPKPEGLPSELADVIIRALDTAARLGIDIDAEVAPKLAYNRTRGHRHGGKAL